ncbi:MAG: ectoine/hydroxyectoine ABC transporter ATP-binding protein EhuA, partial [Firmicutes bacterium HGW-Firmicutes-5]
VIFLDEGQVIEQGRDILSNPKTEALQAFLGKVLSFA